MVDLVDNTHLLFLLSITTIQVHIATHTCMRVFIAGSQYLIMNKRVNFTDIHCAQEYAIQVTIHHAMQGN